MLVAKDVELIAVFEKNGKITPIKFKCEEEEETKVVLVDKILKSQLQKIAGINIWRYECKSCVEDREINYVLKYNMIDGK